MNEVYAAKNASRLGPGSEFRAHGEHDGGRCLAAGMDDYPGKPFKRTQLVAVLESYLSRTPTAAALS